MREQYVRTEMLLGSERLERLRKARVAVFGIGGVGGYVCEALARSGVGTLGLIDNDVVSLSNLNRQMIALHSTIGKFKTDVMRDRILDIDPEIQVQVFHQFLLPENAGEFPFGDYDYIVDAVDTVSAKIEIICRAKALGLPVISSMGAGNKLDGSLFKVTDISKTSVCPLAKVMRLELKRRGIRGVKAVWSEEPPRKPIEGICSEPPAGSRRSTPGSLAFVPSAAGLVIAGEVVRDIALGSQSK